MSVITEVPECTHTLLKMGHGTVYPTVNQCWYCAGEDQPLVFSHEWDCLIHLCCIIKAHAADPTDDEVFIFAREFELICWGDDATGKGRCNKLATTKRTMSDTGYNTPFCNECATKLDYLFNKGIIPQRNINAQPRTDPPAV